MLGGRVKIIWSGGAPLARHIEEFLRIVTCAHVLQGYGMLFTRILLLPGTIMIQILLFGHFNTSVLSFLKNKSTLVSQI
jgi:hypothetical protein